MEIAGLEHNSWVQEASVETLDGLLRAITAPWCAKSPDQDPGGRGGEVDKERIKREIK